MRKWLRERQLHLPTSEDTVEIWSLQDGTEKIQSFELEVKLGKPLDVMRLKGRTTETMRDWASEIRRIVESLYGSDVAKRLVEFCPACRRPCQDARHFCVIHSVSYQQCLQCGHVFVQEQPASDVINSLFSENDDYADTYTDPESLALRLEQIIVPKLDWCRQAYAGVHGRDITNALDIGAGGGHFVAGCRGAGIDARGIEINKAAIRFAQSAFGIELDDSDFLRNPPDRTFDLVSLWGLLEYTPEPDRFVAAARTCLTPEDGLLVLEVPRVDAASSAILSQFPDQAWRHISPETHINIYSDAAIAELLVNNGFEPVAAWYFGMDAYELLAQLAIANEDDALLERFAGIIPALQDWFDRAQLADDIVVAARPV